MRDRSAAVLTGPSATPQQVLNGQLVTFLFTFWARLDKLKDECSEDVLDILRLSVNVRRFDYLMLSDKC